MKPTPEEAAAAAVEHIERAIGVLQRAIIEASESCATEREEIGAKVCEYFTDSASRQRHFVNPRAATRIARPTVRTGAENLRPKE